MKDFLRVPCKLLLATSYAKAFESLRVASPFFSTIVLFNNRPFPWVSGGFLETRIPAKNGEGSTRELRKATKQKRART